MGRFYNQRCDGRRLFAPGDWTINRPMIKKATATEVFALLQKCVAVAGLALTVSFGAPMGAQATETASVPTLQDNLNKLPEVLSALDVERYQRIFALQAKASWKAADKEIALLDDDVLMGHVKAQKLMHPNGYRAYFAELKSWMKAYSDHPQARRVYKLAKRRAGKGASVPRPSGGHMAGPKAGTNGIRWEYDTHKRYRGHARNIWIKFRKALHRGHTLVAKRILREKDTKRLIHPIDYDRMAGALGYKYFIDGYDEFALEWAGKAADRSGANASLATFGAGLASWRLGKLGESAHYFQILANSERSSSWMRAAGGYWAARANLKNRHPERVNTYLEIASKYPRTFYGILARKALGLDLRFSWQSIEAKAEDLKGITSHKIGRRAVALLQIGENALAERELRKLYPKVDSKTGKAIFSLADAAQLPSLAFRLAQNSDSGQEGYRHASALYPVPDWKPDGGWKVDKALVYAFVRQESAFNPRAKSYRGARGLMQLMPATASFIGKNRQYKWSKRDDLFDPALNLQLGQRYLNHLLGHNLVNNNLFLLAAAYNGGPGNLKRWMKKMETGGDPLLFIESLPSRETRIFIERVLSNYWIYRTRMNQPTPSLDELATGDWPLYSHMDIPLNQVAQNVGN